VQVEFLINTVVLGQVQVQKLVSEVLVLQLAMAVAEVILVLKAVQAVAEAILEQAEVMEAKVL
jgi:hypothetical protein